MTQPILTDITMPSLGADMTEGMLVKWLVKVGDIVHNGDIIAELETHKGIIDMEVYQSGTIAEILVQPVTAAPVGTVLARLQCEAMSDAADLPLPDVVPSITASSIPEPLLAEPLTAEIAPTEISSTVPSPIIPAVVETVDAYSNVNGSPIVRKMAAAQQLDLTNIIGSGPHGAILLKDLPQQSATGLPNMRRAIAVAMEKSKKKIPHFYLSLNIDMTKAQSWLQQVNSDKAPEQRLLLIALLLKAVAMALRKFPSLNGFYTDQQLQLADDIHIGNVISLRQGGLIVPAIHQVDTLSVTAIMQAVSDISARSRSGHLRSSELTDATFTVTNMGDRGADCVYGIIYPPQVAILGFGKLRKTALVQEGNLVAGDEITVCLSADHRAIDGMLASKFLNALSSQLQQPECL
ncbi:dihydrolipoamide acetyltransferase family protein [Moritella sp. Urea-trap-13]|uniref:dihydrolipoamide acetyltransferase family protein n=1 Tax=Moritella sp. Urea-trap-13 TaxID=2058327 RepID=UPI001E314325|nr:dihydrolipoamide acetyltransferase family protein [Moritella sp. Urea-trap-13]